MDISKQYKITKKKEFYIQYKQKKNFTKKAGKRKEKDRKKEGKEQEKGRKRAGKIKEKSRKKKGTCRFKDFKISLTSDHRRHII